MGPRFGHPARASCPEAALPIGRASGAFAAPPACGRHAESARGPSPVSAPHTALERIQTDRAARGRDVEVAERGRDVARHERDAARAALLRTQDRRGQPEDAWEVTCPIRGVVLRVLQESEAVVQPGTVV
jgi:hypothetical protein